MKQGVWLIADTDLFNCVLAARTCYDSMNNSDSWNDGVGRMLLGRKDAALLKRIIISGHDSVLEHKVYTFKIEGFSRAVLQELARHRMASLSVRSTRFTLKKMMELNNEEFLEHFVQTESLLDNLEKEYVWHLLQTAKEHGIPPDLLKHKLPESLKFECVWTVNARSLQNFFKLRLSTKAMWETRTLASMVWGCIPPHERDMLFGRIHE